MKESKASCHSGHFLNTVEGMPLRLKHLENLYTELLKSQMNIHVKIMSIKMRMEIVIAIEVLMLIAISVLVMLSR